MTEESERQEENCEKLLIDDASDFKFHVAYMAYSEIFDRTFDLENKKSLNENIVSLQKNKIDYSTFYINIDQFRSISSSSGSSHRSFIKTQKKRDWRRRIQKDERNKRYRK